ncbi:adenylate kinase [Paenibacillus sp. HWE-109]|uniref:adenylate kinase n=1 Tax=Paenibacillus sp. HWE-109 TaxID=1306526 RepID=UPI001EDFB938|nr:adenylate kinase [Paenibacillus sp. HWE-109]UKS30183.1 adenylate kinase [Paenibacillus sp. HWE-109]
MYLAEKYGYQRFAFGDELKRYYHELFGNSTTKPREGYQWFGQTMRQRDPDVWVYKCFDQIRGMRQQAAKYPVAITDLRQPNEYERCRAEGYVIIRVNAPEGERFNRAVASADTFNYVDLRHETESHVDTFAVDYEFENSGSLAELHVKIDAILTGVSGYGRV